MATCGDYELEGAIGWGRRATFFAARANGGAEASVVIRRARSVERLFTQAFLRAAAEQQAAVGAGCRQLAPILAFEHDAAGFAYYATARYETSLAEFLDGGCKADSALLREIAASILGALSELHEKSRRAHGKLTPGNVLLDPDGHIFLTDLAPAAKDATTADDLFSLGTLIYQLVRRTSRIGMLNPPLDYSQDWTDTLGDEAEGWLEFTNRLLDRQRNSGPDAIKSALADMKSLARLAAKAAKATESGQGAAAHVAVRRPPKKKKSPLPLILVIVLLLGGGGGGYWWWKKKENEKKERIEREKEEQRRTEREKTLPPAIRNLRSELKQLPADIANDPTPDGLTLKSLLGRIGKSLDGTGGKEEIKSLLGNWELPDKLKAQAAPWRAKPREWTRLAGELDAAAQIDVEGGTSVIAQLQKAITARAAADDLDRQWGGIALTLKELDAAKNRLLPDFTPWAAGEIRGARDFAEATSRAAGALKTLGEIRDFQRDKWPRVVLARFEKEAAEAVQIPTEDLMPGWPGRWKREAERLVGPTDAKRAEWDGIIADVKKRMTTVLAKDQPKWQAELAKAEADIAAALDTDAATIDKNLLVFRGMRSQVEIAREQYVTFLNGTNGASGWKDRAANATKADAQAVLDEFRSETAKLAAAFATEAKSRDYVAGINSAALFTAMDVALKTPDKTTLALPPEWRDYTPPDTDKGVVVYLYTAKDPSTGKDTSVAVPFIALDKNVAMSAIETPLLLAHLSGLGASPPRDGPQIRNPNGFTPATDWLWPRAAGLTAQGVANYFADGNRAGDMTYYCPATWVTFAEAQAIAAKLGGKLPTSDQWLAAKETHPGKGARLRYSAWAKQHLLLDEWRRTTGNIQSAAGPDIGSFSKDLGYSVGAAYGQDTAAVGPGGDNALWLTTVYPAGWKPQGGWKAADGFHHLTGNAAEWVTAQGKPAIIGGSVVSPGKLPRDTPLSSVSTPTGTYFDVTFRLVVNLGPGGEGAGLDKFKELAAAIQPPPLPPAP